MLKFPKLLRKQYLCYSPLWKAYNNGTITDIQQMNINSKLYSACILKNIITLFYSQQNNKVSQYNIIESNYINYINRQQIVVDDTIKKVRQYIRISKQGKQNYMSKIYTIYKDLYPSNTALVQNAQNNKLMEGKTNHITEKNYLYNYLITLVQISQKQGIDDIDMMILQTLNLNIDHMRVLKKIKLDWYYGNAVSLCMFKFIIFNTIIQSQFTHISLLKTYLNQLKEYLRVQIQQYSSHQQLVNKDCQNGFSSKNNFFLNVFLQSFHQLISSRNSKKDLDKQRILLLMNKIDVKSILKHIDYNCCTNMFKQKLQQSNLSYFQLLAFQYLIYLDYLAMKCLFRPIKNSFLTNLKQFCQKIKFLNTKQIIISQGIKTKKFEKTEEEQLFAIYRAIQVGKLQFITYLYNNLVESISIKSFVNDTYGKILIQTLSQIRNIKLALQNKIFEMFKYYTEGNQKQKKKNIKRPKQTHQSMNNGGQVFGKQNKKSLDQKKDVIKNLRHIQFLINVINANFSGSRIARNFCNITQNADEKTRVNISSEIIINIACKLIQQIISYDIILFDKSQHCTIYTVLRQLINNKLCSHKISKKAHQYYQKLGKYVAAGRKQGFETDKKPSMQSTADLKILWDLLTNKRHSSKKQAQLNQIKQNLFIFNFNSPSALAAQINQKQGQNEEAKESSNNQILQCLKQYLN